MQFSPLLKNTLLMPLQRRESKNAVKMAWKNGFRREFRKSFIFSLLFFFFFFFSFFLNVKRKVADIVNICDS